jgi:RHS repeat-associated protein
VQEWFWLDDMPIAVVQKNNVIYTIDTDHLNTPRQLKDATGKVVWSWNSANFGNLKPNEDPDGDGNKVTFNLRFPGQYYDQETNLHYNYFRDYNPATGRYQQSDPIGLGGGINTFGYVSGNPLSLFDPLGLLWTYCIRSGNISHDGGPVIEGGYSGFGKKQNNPIHAGHKDGPIGDGRWTMVPEEEFKSSVDGKKYYDALRLVPNPGSRWNQQKNNLIHTDNDKRNKSASKGCIVLDRTTIDAIKESNDDQLEVDPFC